jgi:hypothetical protein
MMEPTADAHARARLEQAEVERVDIEALLHLRVRRKQNLESAIEQEPIHAVGPHPTADAVRGLEQLTLDTRAGEILRAGQASKSGTDIRHNNPHRSDPAQSAHADAPPSA